MMNESLGLVSDLLQLAEGLMWKRHAGQLRDRTSSGSTDPFNLEENALRRSKLEQGRSATLEDIMN